MENSLLFLLVDSAISSHTEHELFGNEERLRKIRYALAAGDDIEPLLADVTEHLEARAEAIKWEREAEAKAKAEAEERAAKAKAKK